MDDIRTYGLLNLLKIDLGITHHLRDDYFYNLLESAKNEIERRPLSPLNFTKVDDQMLVVDYAAWTYRKRQEDSPLSRNLQIRINNRIIKKAGTTDAVT